MKKILVVTLTLDVGGITSFVINLANYLAQSHAVTLAYVGRPSPQVLAKFDASVSLQRYETLSKRQLAKIMLREGNLYHLLRIKYRNHKKVTPMPSVQRVHEARARHTPAIAGHFDVAISAAEFFCNDYVAWQIDADRKIGWIHPDYAALHTDVAFDRKTLDRLDRIVAVSESCKQSMLSVIPAYQGKVTCVKNMTDYASIQRLADEEIPDFNEDCLRIVTVCRLDNSSKRLDRMVQACKYMKQKGLSFVWYIVGEGSDYNRIQSLIMQNSLQQHLILTGIRKNPYPYMKRADVFVLTSQYEGQPIVVDEALALHCPVVVTRYQSAGEQVPPAFGRIIENDDVTVSQSLYEIVSDLQQLRSMKQALCGYTASNRQAQSQIDKLVR